MNVRMWEPPLRDAGDIISHASVLKYVPRGCSSFLACRGTGGGRQVGRKNI